MRTILQLPAFRTAIAFLANKYYGKQENPDRLVNELAEACVPDLSLPAWHVWQIGQSILVQILIRQQRAVERELPQLRRSIQELTFQPEELLALGELIMHARVGFPTLQLPWSTVEQVSTTAIDQDITGNYLHQAHLPDTFWIEWLTPPSSHLPPWISRTTGLLVSRLVVFDAPADHQQAIAQAAKQRKTSTAIDLFRALVSMGSDSTPCLGYAVIASQETPQGVRFVPTVFGHELSGSIQDMLAAYKEASDEDKRKMKDAQQVWANVGMRLVLFAASRVLFTGDSRHIRIENPTISELGSGSGIFFPTRTRGHPIRLRKQLNRPVVPFQIEHTRMHH